MIPRLSLSGWLAIALASVCVLWALDHMALSTKASTLAANHDRLLANLATARADAETLQRTRDGDHARAVAALSDQLHATEALNAELETARNLAIAAGTRRVYVRASCPDRASLPADSAAAGGSDGARAELDPAYRRTLSELRRGARACVDRLTTLQAYAREVEHALPRNTQ